MNIINLRKEVKKLKAEEVMVQEDDSLIYILYKWIKNKYVILSDWIRARLNEKSIKINDKKVSNVYYLEEVKTEKKTIKKRYNLQDVEKKSWNNIVKLFKSKGSGVKIISI